MPNKASAHDGREGTERAESSAGHLPERSAGGDKKREPMRISSDPKDQGYRVDHYRFEAYLNGQREPFAVTADEEKGEIVCKEPAGLGIYRTVTKHGHVQIKKLED